MVWRKESGGGGCGFVCGCCGLGRTAVICESAVVLTKIANMEFWICSCWLIDIMYEVELCVICDRVRWLFLVGCELLVVTSEERGLVILQCHFDRAINSIQRNK